MSERFIEGELEAVRDLVRDTVRASHPAARDALGDLADAGGKFLRPRILVLSAMAGTYMGEKIRPLAAAVEILHMATLVHDDVIDDSPTRRGIPSLHARIGRKDAVLAGDFLLSRCFLLASDHTSPENAKGLAKAIDLMVAAEMTQGMDRFSFSPSIRSCLRKIGGKTAVLMSLAARAGATESGSRRDTIQAFSRAAWSAGMAFQIQDDILDWTGDPSKTGKPVLNDIKEGLCTIPLAIALGHDPGALRPLLEHEALKKGSAPEIASIVRSTGADREALEMAKVYVNRSLSELAKTPRSESRDLLSALFSTFAERHS